jgi:tetratricopeptide (TPR) repeat protein
MCFAIVVNVRNNKWPALNKALAAIRFTTVWTRLATVGAIAIAGIACFTVFHAWEAKLRWDELSKRLDDTRTETKAVYERIGVLLNNDGRFMTDYGIFLLEDSADCRQACVILEKAKKLFISRSTIETLAEAYSKQGNDKKSIENYEWLCQYLPNKFRPRLHLLLLYNRTGDTVDAKKLAHAILAMPVKIPSPDVDNVKLEAEAVLSGMR